jgi:hypothetical protein
MIYKVKDPKSILLDPVFTQIASEIGMKQNMYPFAKVVAGLDDAEAANKMPHIVVYHYGKVVHRYSGSAQDFKVMEWLAEILDEVRNQLKLKIF